MTNNNDQLKFDLANVDLASIERHIAKHWAPAIFTLLSHECHETALAKGWWEDDANQAEKIALVHSELSECLEGIRHGNPPSDHIPEFSAAEEELADVIIRVMDMAGRWDYRVGEAVVAKMEYNLGRGHRHGGKKF